MNAIENFIRFLEQTLIPDLKESGDKFMARDFEHAIKFMNGAKRVSGKTRKQFIEYMEGLEKDIREGGREFTADDYFTAVKFIYWMDT